MHFNLSTRLRWLISLTLTALMIYILRHQVNSLLWFCLFIHAFVIIVGILILVNCMRSWSWPWSSWHLYTSTEHSFQLSVCYKCKVCRYSGILLGDANFFKVLCDKHPEAVMYFMPIWCRHATAVLLTLWREMQMAWICGWQTYPTEVAVSCHKIQST